MYRFEFTSLIVALGNPSTLPSRAALRLCRYHLQLHVYYRAATRPGSRTTAACPHGAEPPASLALGGLGVAQQHRALSRGEHGRLGAIAQQLRVRVPITGTSQWASIGQAMGVMGLNRSGFPGGDLVCVTRRPACPQARRSGWLQPRLAGHSRWVRASGGC